MYEYGNGKTLRFVDNDFPVCTFSYCSRPSTQLLELQILPHRLPFPRVRKSSHRQFYLRPTLILGFAENCVAHLRASGNL